MKSILSLVAFLILVFISPSWANEKNNLVKLCETMAVNHVPDASVEYKPGVDVNGKAVAPADIGTQLDMADIYPVYIPLELDILSRFAPNVPNGINSEAVIAVIAVHEDGRTYYNGQDISGELNAYCIDHIHNKP